jgi:hypothetical protein
MLQTKQTANNFGFFLLIFVFSVIVLPIPASAQINFFVLSGEIIDQQKAIIVNAEITLSDENGKEQKKISNRQGIFRFENLQAGKYKLQITAKGFAEYEEELELNSGQEMPQLKITLFPTIREEVAVSHLTETPLDSERAAGTLILRAKDLEDLPDDPERLNEQLQQMAASSGDIPGNAAVTVDGFLNSGRLPSKSSIREVRINPNLYSAEYDTPPFRGGRIEITTKPGAESFHGSTFLIITERFLMPATRFRLNVLKRKQGAMV